MIPDSKIDFVAQEAWKPERPETLVVCCSDGRWHAQVEEFIHQQISARADMYVVPGGPAGFSLWTSIFEEGKGLERAFHFLATHHNLKSTWLIAHQSCAYYSIKYSGIHDENAIRKRQLEDLEYARRTISRWRSEMIIKKVYAHREESRVIFSIVD
jgi:hypothetical protein